jgi:hypothetical protein
MPSMTLPASATSAQVQAAFDQATYGDTITLDRLGVWNGNFHLMNQGPNPTGQYITIKSSHVNNLPALTNNPWDGRVSEADGQWMPKIRANTVNSPALWTTRGASWYKFHGIDFTVIPQTDPLQAVTFYILRIDYAYISFRRALTSGPISVNSQSTGQGVIANGSAALRGDGPWVSADVGKDIVVEGAGVNGADLFAKIQSVTDATHVVLNTVASTAVNTTGQSRKLIRWGTFIYVTVSVSTTNCLDTTVGVRPAISVGSSLAVIDSDGVSRETTTVTQLTQTTIRALFTLSHGTPTYVDADAYDFDSGDGGGNSGMGVYNSPFASDPVGSQQPHHMWFEQCLVHMRPTIGPDGKIRHAITANCGWFALTNSRVYEIKDPYAETHALNGWNGQGPYKFVNNYLEAAGENIILGGTGCTWSVVPGEVVDSATGYGVYIRYNTFTKQLQWNPTPPPGITYVPPFPGGIWVCKNLLEFKSAKNVFVDHNFFQYNWLGEQDGVPLLINLSNYTDGVERVENVTYSNNIIDSTGGGFNIAYPIIATPAQLIKNITFRNNLFTNLGWRYGFPRQPQGRGCFYLEHGDAVTLEHNTFRLDPLGQNVSFFIDADPNGAIASPTNITNFRLFGNIGPGNNYPFVLVDSNGVNQGGSANQVNQANILWPDPKTVAGNVIWDSGVRPASGLFQGNFANNKYAGTSEGNIGFVGPSSAPSDCALASSSTYRVGGSNYIGTDGKDPGCDIAALAYPTTAQVLTTTAFTQSNYTSTAGQNALMDVNVTAVSGTTAPTGNVSITLNGQVYGSPVNPVSGTLGRASFNVPSPPAGTYQVPASFSDPVGGFGSSTANPATLTVNPGVGTGTTTTVLPPMQVTWPATQPINVQVTPASGSQVPTGSVTLTVDGASQGAPQTLSNGIAGFLVADLHAGQHTAVATYSSDGTFSGSTSVPRSFTVAPKPTTTRLTSQPIQQGQDAQVTITVSSP